MSSNLITVGLGNEFAMARLFKCVHTVIQNMRLKKWNKKYSRAIEFQNGWKKREWKKSTDYGYKTHWIHLHRNYELADAYITTTHIKWSTNPVANYSHANEICSQRMFNVTNIVIDWPIEWEMNVKWRWTWTMDDLSGSISGRMDLLFLLCTQSYTSLYWPIITHS